MFVPPDSVFLKTISGSHIYQMFETGVPFEKLLNQT